MSLIDYLTRSLLNTREFFGSDLKGSIRDYQDFKEQLDSLYSAKTMPGDKYGWGELQKEHEKVMAECEAKIREYVEANLVRVLVDVVTSEILQPSQK